MAPHLYNLRPYGRYGHLPTRTSATTPAGTPCTLASSSTVLTATATTTLRLLRPPRPRPPFMRAAPHVHHHSDVHLAHARGRRCRHVHISHSAGPPLRLAPRWAQAALVPRRPPAPPALGSERPLPPPAAPAAPSALGPPGSGLSLAAPAAGWAQDWLLAGGLGYCIPVAGIWAGPPRHPPVRRCGPTAPLVGTLLLSAAFLVAVGCPLSLLRGHGDCVLGRSVRPHLTSHFGRVPQACSGLGLYTACPAVHVAWPSVVSLSRASRRLAGPPTTRLPKARFAVRPAPVLVVCLPAPPWPPGHPPPVRFSPSCLVLSGLLVC